MLVTDWEGEFGLPADTVKGGLCMSGIYDLAPVRLSWRRAFIDFTDEMEEAMSPQRHLDRLNAPLVVTYGTLGSPEFQRQSRDFAAAVEAKGTPEELSRPSHFHQDIAESVGNPYGIVGRSALSLMGLTRAERRRSVALRVIGPSAVRRAGQEMAIAIRMTRRRPRRAQAPPRKRCMKSRGFFATISLLKPAAPP